MENEKGYWFTTKTGVHIFVKDGQSVDDAMKERFDSVEEPEYSTNDEFDVEEDEKLFEEPKKEEKVIPSQEAFGVAKTKIDDVKKIEPQVTKDISEIVKANNGEMFGLDFRVKTEESLARKVESAAKEYNSTYENVVKDMHDVLRYTSKLEPENFVENMNKTIEAIQSKGYKLMKVKNHFIGKGSDSYRDVNTNFQAPDGTIFELQFNTPDGLKVKEPAHELYEKVRVLPEGHPTAKKLLSQMADMWKNVAIPKDVDKIVEVSNY